jgi:hypothetical protein
VNYPRGSQAHSEVRNGQKAPIFRKQEAKNDGATTKAPNLPSNKSFFAAFFAKKAAL